MENLNTSSFVLIGVGITALHYTRKKLNSPGEKEQFISAGEGGASETIPSDTLQDNIIDDHFTRHPEEYCVNSIFSFQDCQENKLNIENERVEPNHSLIHIPETNKGIKINKKSQTFQNKCSIIEHIQQMTEKKEEQYVDLVWEHEPVAEETGTSSKHGQLVPIAVITLLISLTLLLLCVILHITARQIKSKKRSIESSNKTVNIKSEYEPTPNVTSDSSVLNSDSVQSSEDETESVEPNDTQSVCSDISDDENHAKIEMLSDHISNGENEHEAENEVDGNERENRISSLHLDLDESESNHSRPNILRTECYYNAVKSVGGTVGRLPLVNFAGSVIGNVAEGMLSVTPLANIEGEGKQKGLQNLDRIVQNTLRTVDGGNKKKPVSNTVHFPKEEEKKKGKGLFGHALSGLDGVVGFVGGSLTNIVNGDRNRRIRSGDMSEPDVSLWED